MTYDDYAEIEAMNWSTLKLLQTSPKMLDWRRDHPRPDTDALRLGRAIHCAVLEPDRWADAYVVEPATDGRTRAGKAERASWLAELAGSGYVAQPDFGEQRTKAAKASKATWLAAHAGVTVLVGGEDAGPLLGDVEALSASEHALAEQIAAGVQAHNVAAGWVNHGRTEEVIRWTDASGLECKARLDFIAPAFVLDLKSTRQGTLRAIASDFARLLYHGQLAFYMDGAIANRLIPSDSQARVLVVQTVEPYDVMPVYLTEWDLDSGRQLYRSLIHKYLGCRASDWWPGLAPEPIELPLPEWAPTARAHDNEDW